MEGGSWDTIRRQWDMDRYRVMQLHWQTFGPPTYIGVALYLGLTNFKKKDGGPSSELVTDPEEVANFLRTLQGGNVR